MWGGGKRTRATRTPVDQSGVRVTGKKGGCGEVSVQEAFPCSPHRWYLLLEEAPLRDPISRGYIRC